VYSHRFLRISDTEEKNGYILKLNDFKSGPTFGVTLYCDENITKVESPGGVWSFQGSGICLQLGSLQQVSFNFTSPTLKSVFEIEKSKGARLLTKLSLNLEDLPPFKNKPAPTYRQHKVISTLYSGNQS